MKTRNLTKLSNEEICAFLLNGKKGDAMELNNDTVIILPSTGFKKRVIYKDKNVEIYFSYLKVSEDDIIQQFYIISNWWGQIKNSFFTLDGFKGKCEKKLGVININELKSFNNNHTYVPVNNKNDHAQIKVHDFASLTLYCQRKYKASPSYKVVDIISEAPNSWVSIKIHMPNGEIHFSEGTSKKDAANKFAKNFKL